MSKVLVVHMLFRSLIVLSVGICTAGTFTLSNLGMFGVDRFDAILPPGTVSPSHRYSCVCYIASCLICEYFWYCFSHWFNSCLGCNHGCRSISAHTCWHQRWSNWHEKSNAGRMMIYVCFWHASSFSQINV